MTKVLLPVKDCGKGVNKDALPSELAPGLWSDALNIEFNGRFGKRRKGIQAVYTTPTAVPYFLHPFITASARFMVQLGTATAFCDDGSTRTNITSATPPTGGVDDRWTGGDYNGVAIYNNGVDAPYYWSGDTTTDLAALTNWPASYKADTVRPFLDYLVAGAVTKNTGVKYPQLLMWSNAADPGSLPSTWTAADTNQAGDDPMTGKGAIVDMLPYGNTNIVYCRSGRVGMRYVGGNDVFAFDPLPGTEGLLARGCVAECPKGHVFLTGGDVMIHQGGPARSIADGVIKEWLQTTIDSSNAQRSFVVTNPQRSEVWVCFPSTGATTCDRAAVWNWNAETWSIYSLPNVTYGASGLVASALIAGTWASDSGTWDTDATTWDQDEFTATEHRLILATSTPTLGMANTGVTDFGTALAAYRERRGIRPTDADQTMVLRASRWAFDGDAGAAVSVYHGASMTADGEPTYAAAATHTQGTTNWVNKFSTRGRYLAIKTNEAANQILSLRSLELDIRMGGQF